MNLFIVGFFLLVALIFSTVIDNPRHWVFNEKNLQQLAISAIRATQASHSNATSSQIIAAVINAAKLHYPKDVRSDNGWIFNNAGGAMGSMTVLHASFSEYLIIFGTAVGTEGHTGRFLADDFFTIIDGEQWAYSAEEHEKTVYRAGDQHYLPRWVAKQYKMPGKCWALEYARGNIPSMMLFGLADTFTSTLDVVTLWDTVRVSAVNMVGNALRGKI